jgi:AcrR family transcriptional regulator
LDRRTILLAAVTMIDQHDLRHLTMRNLGMQLGVEAMSLYHYVHSREDLLDGVVELVIDDLYGDPDVHLSADAWQDCLQRQAHGVRRIALAYPQVFPLVATRPPAAPWVRPPLRSLRWMEFFLGTLHHWGFTDAGCVGAYRSFSSFLLGHLLLEVSGQGADIGPVERADPDSRPATDLSRCPRLQGLEADLSQDHSADGFEESLETLLDRIDLLEQQPSRRRDGGVR